MSQINNTILHAFIAAACHEANRALCLSQGDNSQEHWEDAPEWQRESAINGVRFKLGNLKATPEDMHNNWSKEKLADGWVYGEVKDVVNKTHPCLVDYDQLPAFQRVKDELFSSIVVAMSKL